MKLSTKATERMGGAIAKAGLPDKAGKALASALGIVVAETLAAVDAELSGLRNRLRDAERKGLRYSGTWQRALQYTQGDVVTHDGSAWVCLSPETKAKPGDGADWQLFVKKGRDAK